MTATSATPISMEREPVGAILGCLQHAGLRQSQYATFVD